MDSSCRMGGILDLSGSTSFEDLKSNDKKHNLITDKYHEKMNKCEDPFVSNLLMKDKQILSLDCNYHGDISETVNVVMTSSLASVNDSTPSDSGVQLLDSEMSEASLMSISAIDIDCKSLETSLDDVTFITLSKHEVHDSADKILTRSDITNSNAAATFENDLNNELDEKKILTYKGNSDEHVSNEKVKAIEKNVKSTENEYIKSRNNDNFVASETMKTSYGEDKSGIAPAQEDNENIVYRRRIKKKPQSAPKKRVSFHEDILKNTKTDNIHIEHGFITYKPELIKESGRYSWCSEGDSPYGKTKQIIVQRNANSDVLDYGRTEVIGSSGCDNSGVFEYGPNPIQEDTEQDKIDKEDSKLYTCSCSSSNSSLDDSSGSETKNKYDKTQKSYSCDCIGTNSFQDNTMNENCYYSEPNIGAVWSKEKKPKSSCLKKSSYTTRTDVVQEYECSVKLKKYNAHSKKSDSNLLDSRTIFGSLKNIYKSMSFGLTLAERGVPEGSEDITVVTECLPETDITPSKPKTFLSKSFDAGFCERSKHSDEFYPSGVRTFGDGYSRNYIHDVDAQLRRKNNDDIFGDGAPQKPNLDLVRKNSVDQNINPDAYRNKFIVNGESTVFEHTGVSYSYEYDNFHSQMENSSFMKLDSVELPDTKSEMGGTSTPLKEKITKIFKGLSGHIDEKLKSDSKMRNNGDMYSPPSNSSSKNNLKKLCSNTSSTELTSDSESFTTSDYSENKKTNRTPTRNNYYADSEIKPGVSKHLSSPLRKRNITRYEKARLSPDLFNLGKDPPKINLVLSNDQDDLMNIEIEKLQIDDEDILTIESGIENLEMLSQKCDTNQSLHNITLKSATSKTSLINRFLRNVTQRKLLDSKLKNNEFFLSKVNNERKLFKSLYLKSAKPNQQLCDDLNKEIEREMMEENMKKNNDAAAIKNRIALGEIDISLFKNLSLDHFRSPSEILQKAFNMNTCYDRLGQITPVVVFLTDKMLYVCTLRNNKYYQYCNKFVLPYSDLDVILLGPAGHTILLANVDRDMQYTLCPGGAFNAGAFASALDLCARLAQTFLHGSLPACGALSLNHLTGLQRFVWENSTVAEMETWYMYAIIRAWDGPGPDIPGDAPISGYLMHRALQHPRQNPPWQVGYFMLKAGVLYTFADVEHKLPTQALPLGPGSCLGARRVPPPCRPHAFELILPGGKLLQMAAPDEYSTSDWLQALVQAASGHFEFPELRPTAACTLVLTSRHILTLRENFDNPLPLNAKEQTNTPSRRPSSISQNSSASNTPVKQNNLLNKSLQGDVEKSSYDYINKSDDTSIKSDSKSDITLEKLSSKVEYKLDVKDIRSHSLISADGSILGVQQVKLDNGKSHKKVEYGKGYEVLSCAAIAELTALKIPMVEESWCILEFSCHEVRESSGDLVLFFSNNSELERFIATIELLWSYNNTEDATFPLGTLDATDSLSLRCGDSHGVLAASWGGLVPPAATDK